MDLNFNPKPEPFHFENSEFDKDNVKKEHQLE